jgi:PBP1b-binding outer membrane lipoprotein LpoB
VRLNTLSQEEVIVKKIFILALSALVLSGCASMWKGMGVATEESEVAREAKLLKEIESVKQALTEMQGTASDAKTAVAKVEEIKQAVAVIQSRLDTLPDETLLKISNILAKAVAEIPPANPGSGK